jgi:hypothetical protein
VKRTGDGAGNYSGFGDREPGVAAFQAKKNADFVVK